MVLQKAIKHSFCTNKENVHAFRDTVYVKCSPHFFPNKNGLLLLVDIMVVRIEEVMVEEDTIEEVMVEEDTMEEGLGVVTMEGDTEEAMMEEGMVVDMMGEVTVEGMMVVDMTEEDTVDVVMEEDMVEVTEEDMVDVVMEEDMVEVTEEDTVEVMAAAEEGFLISVWDLINVAIDHRPENQIQPK